MILQFCVIVKLFCKFLPLEVSLQFCSVWHGTYLLKQWYFVTKIVLTYCEKKCSSGREKLLKFEADDQEFAKFLRSLEQFIETMKDKNNY